MSAAPSPSPAFERVTVAALFAFAAALCWRSVTDLDVGLHLAGGRFLFETGGVPDRDPFTWTVADRPYLAYHWLFQALVYGVDRVAGVVGLVALRFALLVGTLACLVDVVRTRGASVPVACALGALGLVAAEWRFALRPELMSGLLAAGMLAILERQRVKGRAPLWGLPLLQLVWVNSHIHVFGLAILGSYAVAEAWRRGSLRTPLVGWSLAAIAVCFVNPYGVAGALVPLELATRLSGENVFAAHIVELRSPFALAPSPDDPFSTGPALAAFRLWFVLALVALALQLWRRRVEDGLLLLAFGVLAALTVRSMALFVVVAYPALCAAFDPGARAREGAVARGLQALLAASLVFAVVGLPRVVAGSHYAADRRPQRFAAELCRPCLALDTADTVARSSLSGRGFNNLAMGSVLVWRDPARKVFIDGRNEVTGEAFFREYLAALDARRWPETKQRYTLDYVVLAHRGDTRASDLARALLDDADWKAVHLGGAGALFVRRSGPNGALAEAVLPEPVDAPERASLLEGIQVESGSLARVWRWLTAAGPPLGEAHGLGNFLARVGRPAAAERPLLEAARRHPNRFEPHLDLGLVERDLGNRRESLRSLRRAYELAPSHPGLAPIGEALER